MGKTFSYLLVIVPMEMHFWTRIWINEWSLKNHCCTYYVSKPNTASYFHLSKFRKYQHLFHCMLYSLGGTIQTMIIPRNLWGDWRMWHQMSYLHDWQVGADWLLARGLNSQSTWASPQGCLCVFTMWWAWPWSEWATQETKVEPAMLFIIRKDWSLGNHALLLYSTGHTRPALIHGGRRQRVKHQVRVTGGWTDTLCPISGSTAAPSCLIPF